MLQLQTKNRRSVFYSHLAEEPTILNELKEKNWLCLIYCNKFSAKTHAKIIQQIIEANALFVYCVGSNHPDLEECVINELCIKYDGFNDDSEGLPLTFSDNDLKGAIKFCVESAFHETKEIEEIVIIDLNDEGLTSEKMHLLF